MVDIRAEADIGQHSKEVHDDIAEGEAGHDNPVTRGDEESHKAMTFGFQKYFPTIHVVSEEDTESPDLSSIAAPSLRNREVRLNNECSTLSISFINFLIFKNNNFDFVLVFMNIVLAT